MNLILNERFGGESPGTRIQNTGLHIGMENNDILWAWSQNPNLK